LLDPPLWGGDQEIGGGQGEGISCHCRIDCS